MPRPQTLSPYKVAMIRSSNNVSDTARRLNISIGLAQQIRQNNVYYDPNYVPVKRNVVRLTAAQVKEMRSSKETDAYWAEKLGCHVLTIGLARRNITHHKPTLGTIDRRVKVTTEKVMKLLKKYTQVEVAKILGVTQPCVSHHKRKAVVLQTA